MPRRIYLQDKIIQSRVWKWVIIIGTAVGLVATGWFFYDKFVEDEFIIEQRISPEAMDGVRERLDRGEEVILEKGIRRNNDESGSPSN